MLYGNFGSDIPTERFYLPADAPHLIGQKDFEDAFWVKTKQNCADVGSEVDYVFER